MIEKNWLDKTIYYVGFLVESSVFKNGRNRTKYRKIYRMVVLPTNLTKNEVKNLILIKFDNVVEITCIDEVADGLLLK